MATDACWFIFNLFSLFCNCLVFQWNQRKQEENILEILTESKVSWLPITLYVFSQYTNGAASLQTPWRSLAVHSILGSDLIFLWRRSNYELIFPLRLKRAMSTELLDDNSQSDAPVSRVWTINAADCWGYGHRHGLAENEMRKCMWKFLHLKPADQLETGTKTWHFSETKSSTISQSHSLS